MRPALTLVCLTLVACPDDDPGADPRVVDPNVATFGAGGGEHSYPNGLHLAVPPGALSGPTEIRLRDLTAEEMAAYLRIRGVTAEQVLFAYEAEPDGLQFAQPVTVTVPVNGLTPGAGVLINELHLAEGWATVADVEFVTDPGAGTLTVSVHHFSGNSGEIQDLLDEDTCANPATACRCLGAHTKQLGSYASCSRDDCQVIHEEILVTYNRCPDSPTATVVADFATEGCSPELTLSAAKSVLGPGEQTTVTAALKLGCLESLPGRTIGFSAAGPGTIRPDEDVTDDSGRAHTQLTGDEEGMVVVSGGGEFTWFTDRLVISGEVQRSHEGTAVLIEEVDVTVVEKPILDLSTMENTIATDSSTVVTATLTRQGNPEPAQSVSFTIRGPATIAPTSALTGSDGSALALLSASGSEGTAIVEGSANVDVTLPGGETVAIPVSATTSVYIGDDPDYAGSVWEFAYTHESITYYDPIGCEETGCSPPCTCAGDAEGMTLSDYHFETLAFSFTIVREVIFHQVVPGPVSGSVEISSPGYQYAETRPLDAGLGNGSCDCDNQGHTRTDKQGVDAVSGSAPFSIPDPTEDDLRGEFYMSGLVSLWAGGSRDILLELTRNWSSSYSTCACLGWDGTRNYSDYPDFTRGVSDFQIHELPLKDQSWTETDSETSWENTSTYSLTCVQNCDL